MFTATIVFCLGLGAESLRLDPALERRYHDLLRRIDQPEAATGADVSTVEAEVVALAPEMEVMDSRRSAALWSRFARWAGRLGAIPVAAEAHARSADVSRRAGDRIGAALALHESGLWLKALGRSADALERSAEAARTFQEAGARASEALARIHSGRTLEDLGRWEEASREYKKALRINIDLGVRHAGSAETLNRLGLVLVEAGQDAEGTKCFEAAEKLCAELGDPERAARLSMDRARAHERKERLDEALEDLEKAADHYRDAEDARTAARIGMRRGTVLLRKGRPADAVPLLDAAISALENPRDEASLMEAFVARARASAALGRADAAIRDWNEGMNRARGREGPLRMAQLLVSKAADMAALGRLEEALRDATEGLETFEKLELKPQIAGAARARAALLVRLGRSRAAIADLTRAKEIYTYLGNQAARNVVALRCASLLSNLGRDADALREYERLIPDLRKSGREDLARRAVMESGMALLSLGKPEQALERFDSISKAVQRDGKDEERSLLAFHRGKALVDLGRCPEALEALEGASRGKARDIEDARVLLQRGRALCGLERIEEALAALSSAERLAVSLGGLEVASAARSERAGMHVARNEMREAMRELEGAAEAFEKAVHESTCSSEEGTPAGLEAEGRRILSNAMRALRAMKDPSRELVASAYQVVQVVRGAGMAGAAGRPRAATAVRAEEVQKVLPEGAAVLEIVDDGASVMAFVMTRGSLDVVSLGTSEEVARDAERVLESVEGEASLRELGRRVLDPVLSRLPPGGPARTLFIAPDGSLSRVPFEALLTAAPSRGAAPKDWPYLVKAFAVAHVHSGTAVLEAALAAKESRSGGRRRFVAFAYPRRAEVVPPVPNLATGEDYPKPVGHGPIPWALLETLSIARLFAGEKHVIEILKLESRIGSDPAAAPGEITEGQVTLFLGEAATEKALKTRSEVKDARVLHIACQGRADLDVPILSHLVLSTGAEPDREDGLVMAGELRSLDLDADLVVLSGCEAASGCRRPFEGLSGLPRAGLAAGARSVLSTLCHVEGDEARRLLERFYRMWLEGSATRTGALATAKRMAIKDGIPIRTWSAYILWDAGG